MHSHHSHSGAFCSHAAPNTSPWSMLENARQKGFTHYALTEHVPRALTEHLYPEEREANIGPSDLAATFERYLVEARKAAKYYNDGNLDDESTDKANPPMQVLVGAETENVDGRNSDCLDFLSDVLGLESKGKSVRAKVDFLVGSVHHVHGIPIDFDKETFEKALTHMALEDGIGPADTTQMKREHQLSAHLSLIAAYLDAQYAMMLRFKPEVIGHFDLCRLFQPDTPMTRRGRERLERTLSQQRHDDSHHIETAADQTFILRQLDEVSEKVTRNVQFACGYGALFEVNAASVRKGWATPYPADDVLDVILEHGGKLCMSDDAHSHEQVGLNYHVALQYLAQKGVEHIWVLTRASDHFAGGESNTETLPGSTPFPRGTVAKRKPLVDSANFSKPFRATT